jgi:hypothetical protein
MKPNCTSKLLIAALCGFAYAPAFAQTPFIIEDRSGGLNYTDFTSSGWATSGGNVNAPGCTLNIGSMYSPTGTSYGPSRYAQFSYAPTTTGYYEVDLAWTLSAGEINTAVNLYTGAATGNSTADIWGNTGGPQGIVYSTTMNMLNNGTSGTGAGTWKPVTTAQLTSGTTYNLGIYGGYKTPYAGGATAADANANRVIAGAARFIAAAPLAVTYSGPANGATGVAVTGTALGWTAGSYDSFYNVWFGTSAGSLTEIGTGLSASTLSLNLDNQNLQGGTEYFWRVDAGNVDAPLATGSEFDFTTVAVPEPSTAVLSLLGGLGLAAWISRRRTA